MSIQTNKMSLICRPCLQSFTQQHLCQHGCSLKYYWWRFKSRFREEKTLCAFKKHLPYLKTCFVLGNFCRNEVPALLPRSERILMRVCGISVFSFWSEELHGETTAPVALTSQSGFKTTVNAVRTCWMVLTGRHCAAGGLRSSPGAPGLIAAAGSFLLTESDTLKHKNDVWKARKLSRILQDETYDSRGFYLSSLTGKRKEQKEKALMF